MLKSSLISDSDTLLKEIEERRFSCINLEEKMFSIDKGILSIYLKDVLKVKDIEKKVFPVLFKSLK